MKRLALLLLSLPLISGCAAAVATGATTTAVTVAQERTVGNAVDDTGILLTIKNLYLQSQDSKLLTEVGVEVIEGRVLLTGAVEKPHTALEAVRYAWLAEGVKEVINEIRVTDQSSLSNYALDVWISAQVKSRLLLEKHVRSINYSVETVNAEVFLFGIAQDQVELDKALYIARTTKYVKEVTSHVRLKSDPRRKGM